MTELTNLRKALRNNEKAFNYSEENGKRNSRIPTGTIQPVKAIYIRRIPAQTPHHGLRWKLVVNSNFLAAPFFYSEATARDLHSLMPVLPNVNCL